MKQEQQEITEDFLGAHCKVTGLDCNMVVPAEHWERVFSFSE